MAANAGETIAEALKGIDFPCGKSGLVEFARKQGADPGAVAVLEDLPERDYADMAEVFRAAGNIAPPADAAWMWWPWTWWSQMLTAWSELNRCLLAQWSPWER